MQTSLILLKPDCVTGQKVGEVIKRFEDAGFQIRGAKLMKLSSEVLAEHYGHLADKPFFPEIVAFMQSSPVLALALAGDNAVERVRALLGPTDSKKADKGTIRADLASGIEENVAHGSDSVDNARIEIAYFFAAADLCPRTR